VPELERRASGLKLLVLDVDGVLTSGDLYLIGEDLEAKRYNFHDGLGIALLRSAGIKIALMSDRSTPPLYRRAKELNVDDVAPVVGGDKETSLNQLLEKMGLSPAQAGYMGDDLRDVPPMKLVGVPIAVANARPEVKAASVHVTAAAGGDGAVREAAEWLLDLRGQKEAIMAPFVQTREEQAQSANGGATGPAGGGD
jgi:3-deoxy-D-manno-octulosonate 8-phosphate phosphatase (KDO 8-P phosphatase)